MTQTSPPPPAADGLLGVAARFTKSTTTPGSIDVTFDAATCGAENAVILYGAIGAFSQYTGCADAAAGATGTASFDASGLGSVWFNIVWTNGTTAGHPGFARAGGADVARSWTAAGMCGTSADDFSRTTCP